MHSLALWCLPSVASLRYWRELNLHLLIILIYFNLRATIIMNKTAIRTDFTVLQRITRDFTTCIKDLSTCLWVDRA